MQAPCNQVLEKGRHSFDLNTDALFSGLYFVKVQGSVADVIRNIIVIRKCSVNVLRQGKSSAALLCMGFQEFSGGLTVYSEPEPAQVFSSIPSCYKNKAVHCVHVSHGFENAVTGA